MLTKSTQRVFIPLLMMAFLLLGAFAAQAQEYREGDRVAKGAAVGAAVGTLFQMIQGRTEGHQLLKGALVGSAVGAVAGAYDDAQRDRDGYAYQQDGYAYRDGYDQQDGVYGQDGYVVQGYAAPNVYVYPYGYQYRSGYEGHRRGGDFRDSRAAGRYDHDGRYDRHDRDDHRAHRRGGDRYGHR